MSFYSKMLFLVVVVGINEEKTQILSSYVLCFSSASAALANQIIQIVRVCFVMQIKQICSRYKDNDFL